MLRALAKNNSARSDIKLFSIINTTNNNENSLFSVIDKAIHGRKEEEAEEVVIVEKKSNLGLIFAVAGAAIIAVTAVSWLLFTAFKLAGGSLPWEVDYGSCGCDELECCEEELFEEEV